MLIYKLTFASGKSYIGQTVKTLEARIKQHRNAANKGSPLAVHCAWRKHGDPASEVLSVHQTMDDLHTAEIAAIRACGTLSPNGYNLGYGGETAPSTNPQVAAKISAKAIGRVTSLQTKEMLSAAMAERWRDPEYRSDLADKLATTWTPKRRAAAAERSIARCTGSKLSEATKRKISERMSNLSDETKAKMSASAKARIRQPFSAESCARVSDAVAASWKDPETSKRRGNAISAAHRSPEGRAKNKAAAVERWANPEYRANRAAMKAARTAAKEATQEATP